MRLLDLVAQSKSAAPLLPGGRAFPSAHHFADAVRTCPLRLVLADDLIQCTSQLAYAEGERLSGCLDLIHVPSQQLWLEWLEATIAELETGSLAWSEEMLKEAAEANANASLD